MSQRLHRADKRNPRPSFKADDPGDGAVTTGRPALAKCILDGIRIYRDDCPEFLAFPPVHAGDAMSRAVASLIESYAPSASLPGEGGRRWRALVRASVAPEFADYFKVFDELDAFEQWVVTHYSLGSTEEETPHQRAAKRWMVPSGQLKETPQRVLEQVGLEPRKATTISRAARISKDYGRAVLADLGHLGLIRHITGEGYVLP